MRRFFVLTFLALTLSASTAFGDDAVDSVLDNLEWRNIGPAIMGGRINDFELVESNPNVAFVATHHHRYPRRHTLNVIREHPDNGALLFAGGERGVYVSFNGGEVWHEMRGSFPRVPVDDIANHLRDNDLILGTHGRSIWVLDDMKPFENLSDAVLAAKLHVFPIRDAINYRSFHYRGNPGH